MRRPALLLWIPALVAAAGSEPSSTAAPRSQRDGEPPPVLFLGLGDLPGGDSWSEALAISDDGSVVAGRSASTASREEGFRWTLAGGMEGLGGPPGLAPDSEPR